MHESRRGQFVLHMSVAASLVCTRPMTSLCTSPSAEAKRTVSNAGSLLSSSHVPSFGASTFKMEDESVRRLSRCWSVCLKALKERMLVSHLGARVQSRACFGGCGYDGSAAAGPSPSTAPLHLFCICRCHRRIGKPMGKQVRRQHCERVLLGNAGRGQQHL